MLNKIFNNFVYKFTKKPDHYIHVDNPKNLQDYRQIQYNNWCKRKGVYNGSYLPENPNTLLKKGWRNITRSKIDDHYKYERKSSKQVVRFDKDKIEKGILKDKHYHWENPKLDTTSSYLKKKTNYIDRYGKVCARKSKESHIAPKDRKYDYK